jgi:hypothetical protein
MLPMAAFFLIFITVKNTFISPIMSLTCLLMLHIFTAALHITGVKQKQ